MIAFLRAAGLLFVSAALAFGAIACGDDGDDGDNGGDATESAATESAGTPSGAGNGTTQNVSAQDFSFSPARFSAPSGEPLTVLLENSGSATHTLTVYSDEEFTTAVEGADTARVSAGGTGQFVVTFDDPGDYYFRCEVHPSQMQGEITVD